MCEESVGKVLSFLWKHFQTFSSAMSLLWPLVIEWPSEQNLLSATWQIVLAVHPWKILAESCFTDTIFFCCSVLRVWGWGVLVWFRLSTAKIFNSVFQQIFFQHDISLLPVPYASCYSAHPQTSKLWVLPGCPCQSKGIPLNIRCALGWETEWCFIAHCQETAEEAVLLEGMVGIIDRNTHVSK